MIRGGIARVGVGDVDAAVRFAIETLGMKLVEAPATIDAGEGFCIELVKDGPKADIVFFTKLPLDQTIAILENRGVTVENGSFRDPYGNRFTLRQG